MATPKKIDTVKDLGEKVAKAKAIVLTDYQGLTHKQLEQLRKALKKVNAEFTIAKNTLLKRALVEHKKTLSDSILTHTTAALFAYEDEASPVKELVQFFKTATKGKLKSGLLGDVEMNETELERLATLPPRMQLLAQLAAQLMAPVSGLHNALSWNMRKLVWALDAVKNKKQ